VSDERLIDLTHFQKKCAISTNLKTVTILLVITGVIRLPTDIPHSGSFNLYAVLFEISKELRQRLLNRAAYRVSQVKLLPTEQN
jgi:hypothetical protein